MNYLGISYDMKHIPELDPGFIPFGIWMNEYAKGATMPIAIAVERNEGSVSVLHAKIYGTTEMAEADYRFAQSCLTFYNPMDSSVSCSSIRGILQARILEWVAIFFSNA